jgi:hypothetical protein
MESTTGVSNEEKETSEDLVGGIERLKFISKGGMSRCDWVGLAGFVGHDEGRGEGGLGLTSLNKLEELNLPSECSLVVSNLYNTTSSHSRWEMQRKSETRDGEVSANPISHSSSIEIE